MKGIGMHTTKYRILCTIFITSFFLVSQTEGATKDELQGEVDRLLQRVSTLQQELSSITKLPPSTQQTSDFIFSRNLSIGSTGEDVKNLQKLLNENSRTRVRESGTGSPGNETIYFGFATKSAVIKFQELYKEEILVPSGLTQGSGFVGEKTRQKLTSISAKGTSLQTASKMAVPLMIPPEVDTRKPQLTLPVSQESDMIYISGMVDNAVVQGGTLTIYGAGFDANNTVRIGDVSIANIHSADGASASFTLPPEITIDTHHVRIVNSKGKESNPMLFIVTKKNPTPPIIQALTPSEGPYGQKITITGQNFSATNNDILSSYAIIENIPSPDGKTLSFEILPFPEIPELQVGVALNKGFELPLYFYVVNENGISNQNFPGKFLLKI